MAPKGYQSVRNPGGWMSASPLPDREELRAFYADLYFQQPQTTSYQREYDELELAYRDLKCRALLRAFSVQGLAEGASLLDVGAGEGFVMDAAARHGFAVTGADFSSFGVAKFFPYLQDRLIAGDVSETLATLRAGGVRFAACSAVNVLEHVLEPAALLDDLSEVLAPRGLLAITVPNDYSPLQAQLIRDRHIDHEFWFAPPQHLHYFNAENLPAFCQAAGYELLDAFADFPIDLYLLHPGSNYVKDTAAGPAAHRARMSHDLLAAQAGLDAYLDLYRAYFRVGIGRDLTVILRRAAS